MRLTRKDIERAAAAIEKRHHCRVSLGFLHPSANLPYHVMVLDPRSSMSVDFRPASIAEAVWRLSGIADGLDVAAARKGHAA